MHVQEAETDAGKRAFTRAELQAFFDHADEQVTRIRGRGRKGWLPAFRDAALFKVAYAFGLRRNEARMLDVADLGRNPHAPEFGDYGVVYVRFGKAMTGSPPKRRSVLTVWPWAAEILQQWEQEVRPLFATADKGEPDGDETAGQLPVAATGGHARPWHVRHPRRERPGAPECDRQPGGGGRAAPSPASSPPSWTMAPAASP